MEDGSAAAAALFIVFLITVAIMQAFGEALDYLNPTELEKETEDFKKQKKNKKILKILYNTKQYRNSMIILMSIDMVVMGYYLLPQVNSKLFGSIPSNWFYVGLIATAIIMLFVFMVLGVVIPKKLGERFHNQIAYHCVEFGHLISILLRPATGVVTLTARCILRIFGIKNTKDNQDVTEEEIISMVNEGHEQGVLLASEAKMINNIFEFVDKEAQEIMTKRSNIIAIDQTTPLIDALNYMLSHNNSRYPVYDDNMDHIVGVLYLKDAMRFHAKDEKLNKPISEVNKLIRKAIFIPETMNINDLFKKMQSSKTQMVIVVDEYGQTAGLVAMEDILEEIVGNIMDEYDVEEKHIKKQGNAYIIDGSTTLSDIEEQIPVKFDQEEFETINGYLISKLDRLPQKDEKFQTTLCGYEFKILSVENRMIQKISVKKIQEKVEE